MDLEQASDRLTAIPSRMLELGAQLARRPGRHAPPVPAVEERERLVIIERKPSHETTAHPEGVRVTMLTRNRGAYPPQIPTSAFETTGETHRCRTCEDRHVRRDDPRSRKIGRRVHPL